VRVSSVLSPWLTALKIGDIYSLPVSASEGCFSADTETFNALWKNGQIATLYVDLTGNPTYDIRYNPGGSAFAVEGITSPDGRIFGRMGQIDRNAPGLYLNVPGDYDESLFASAVAYFR
jgi:phosphoribosylformylglycinamidine synthase